jgi:hypothetical protein
MSCACTWTIEVPGSEFSKTEAMYTDLVNSGCCTRVISIITSDLSSQQLKTYVIVGVSDEDLDCG